MWLEWIWFSLKRRRFIFSHFSSLDLTFKYTASNPVFSKWMMSHNCFSFQFSAGAVVLVEVCITMKWTPKFQPTKSAFKIFFRWSQISSLLPRFHELYVDTYGLYSYLLTSPTTDGRRQVSPTGYVHVNVHVIRERHPRDIFAQKHSPDKSPN